MAVLTDDTGSDVACFVPILLFGIFSFVSLVTDCCRDDSRTQAQVTTTTLLVRPPRQLTAPNLPNKTSISLQLTCLSTTSLAMARPSRLLGALPLLLCLCALPSPARSQNATAPLPASVEGFNCSRNSSYPCLVYALYRAGFVGEPLDLAGFTRVPLDLATVGDLFGVSRFMVAHANNLSVSTAPANGQPLLVPLQCGCPSGSPNAYAPTPREAAARHTVG